MVKDPKEEVYSLPEKTNLSSKIATSPKLNRTALSIDSGVMMGSPSPPTDSGIRVSPPTQMRQVRQQSELQKHSVKSNKTTAVAANKEEEGVVSSDDTESLCSSALSVQSDTSGSCYDNVLRAQNPPSGPIVKTSTLVAAAAEIAAASYLTRVEPVAVSLMPQSRDEDGDDEDTDASNSDSDNLDLDSYSDEESEPEEKEVISKEKRKPRMTLPSNRNSGPYENFRNESAEGTGSSSSFTSTSSSPKVTRKKVLRDLKENKTDIASREKSGNSKQQQQQHQQQQNAYSNPEVKTTPAPFSDSSIRNFLAAGQTSNV